MMGTIVGLFAAPSGGVPKARVETLLITTTGCAGDKQNDLKHHGGPTKAVCIMAEDLLIELQREGHPIQGGTTGENLLISGIPWNCFHQGYLIKTEEVVLRITGDAPPCKTIKDSFTEGSFKAISHKITEGRTRWYAEVIEEGRLHHGENIALESIS